MCFEWLWEFVVEVERQASQKQRQQSNSVQEFVAEIQKRYTLRIEALWTQSLRLREQIRVKLARKDIAMARAVATQRLQVLASRTRCIGLWSQLSTVVLQLHAAQLAPQMVQALRAAKGNLSAHHADMKDAEQVMDDLRDYHQLGAELDQALSAPIDDSPIDPSALDQELEEIAALDKEQLPVVVSAVSLTPIRTVTPTDSPLEFMDSLSSSSQSSNVRLLDPSQSIDSVAN